jgi:hypothetical protein
MAETTGRSRPPWAGVVMTVLVTVPIVATPTLTVLGILAGPAFLGHEPVPVPVALPDQSGRSAMLLAGAFLVGTVLPLTGFLLTFRTGQAQLRRMFVIVFVLSLAVVGVAVGLERQRLTEVNSRQRARQLRLMGAPRRASWMPS